MRIRHSHRNLQYQSKYRFNRELISGPVLSEVMAKEEYRAVNKFMARLEYRRLALGHRIRYRHASYSEKMR